MLTVHLRINDAATGKPTPVRLRVSGPDNAAIPPLGRASDFPSGRNEDVGGHLKLGRERWYYIDGVCEIPLPAGVPLRVQAAKGAEYTPLDQTVVLGAGKMALRFAIERWADTRADGWVSIDSRCHFIAPHAALLEAAAEDIDVVNVLATPFPMLALDGNTYTTTPNLLVFSGQTLALEVGGRMAVVNTLNAHPVLGQVGLLHSHRPVFPLAFGGEETDDWSICDWCDQCHRKGGLTAWVNAFEPAGGLMGGEALVALILGKIDAIEVCHNPRAVPLLPWVYRLWDAGFRVPLIGGSGKDSNKVALGSTRTYADCRAASWVDTVRAGRTFITNGPLLTLGREGDRVCASVRSHTGSAKVEIVANGRVIATGDGAAEAAVAEPAWVAARCHSAERFAHWSPIVVGAPPRNPEAVASLRKLIDSTREWIETLGRFANPKRKQALLARIEEALAKL